VSLQTRALEVLSRWRAVERDLAEVDAGTPESDDLRAEAIRLRDEYQELILAARRVDAPEPPPFPLE
jgi:chemotaxis regulatin CheY-phosphate phosphatase CheZ